MVSYSWVTLATNDDYAIGALVLGESLKKVQTKYNLHIMITSEVSQPIKERLSTVYNSVTLVNVLDSNDKANLKLINRPDLGVTFTKLNCWRLTQYEKAVFLDADTLVLQNSDELFEREEFSAAADVGWPDCFNSGVFVFKPSDETYQKLIDFALTHGSFDGGDQGLLNSFFSSWATGPSSHRLPFIYNMTSGSFYSYAAAYNKFHKDIKIVHFIGAAKPWNTKDCIHKSEHFCEWRHIYQENVSSTLPQQYQPAVLTPDEEDQRLKWEQGQPEYWGRDAYENIQKAVERSMNL
uniref:glycogenin glucosyltransferase n=1 Tax=Parastrongyloides trichosuri TaxID=131310 RepID=A0A0N4ZGJ3_PARTI